MPSRISSHVRVDGARQIITVDRRSMRHGTTLDTVHVVREVQFSVALRQTGGNEATTGAIRLNNNTFIEWRNSGDSLNIGFGVNSDNNFFMDAGLDMNGQFLDNVFDISDNSANPAIAGFVRIGNDIAVNWRNNANDADLGIKLNTSDEFEIEGFVHHPIILVRKTADQVLNDDGDMQNDTHLLFAIAANEIWMVEFFIHFASNTAADFKADITVPSGATGRRHSVAVDEADANFIGELFALSGSSLTADVEAPGSGSTNTYLLLTYLVVNSVTPGNVTLRWAQQFAHASDTTVFLNSWLRATRF